MVFVLLAVFIVIDALKNKNVDYNHHIAVMMT